MPFNQIFQSDSIFLVICNTNSGGVTINDCFIHAAVPDTPFGGVGEAGYGYYHGKYGMLAFSHMRTIVALPTWMDKLLSFRYPPFTNKNLGKVRVDNNLGFKRGEGIVDQKIRNAGYLGRLGFAIGTTLGVISY